MSQILHLKGKRVVSSVTGLGYMSSYSSKLVNSTIRSQITTNPVILDCIVLPRITVDIPTVPLDFSNCKILHDIQLADPK